MLDFGPVRKRLIAIAIMAAAMLVAWFAGAMHAQPLERDGPEFMVRRGWVEPGDFEHDLPGIIYKIRHHRTGACWILFHTSYKSGMAEAPPEVCK